MTPAFRAGFMAKLADLKKSIYEMQLRLAKGGKIKPPMTPHISDQIARMRALTQRMNIRVPGL